MNANKNLSTTIKSIGVITAVLVTFGCSAIGGNSFKNQAIAAIREDQKFYNSVKQDVSIDLLVNAGASAAQENAGFGVEEAKKQVRLNYTAKHPELFVAEHLGLLKIYFEEPELITSGYGITHDMREQNLGSWSFRPRTEVTEKGRQLWKDLDIKVSENRLPLAVRGTPEITGIAEEDLTSKKVEFSYGWEPTVFGKALDPSREEFKSLPKEIQEAMGEEKDMMFGSSSRFKDFSKKERGVARFKKYEDGWRLRELFIPEGRIF